MNYTFIGHFISQTPEEQLIDPSEADNLSVTIDVPAINEEEQFGVSREDLPKSPDESVANEEHQLAVLVGSAEADPSFTIGSSITIIQQFGVSREDLPKTTDAPMAASGETDNLPVSIDGPATNEGGQFGHYQMKLNEAMSTIVCFYFFQICVADPAVPRTPR
jgi:hypothetical protein